MTAHLLQLAVGPVQEFIAAARRTRDLWFGSYLLSEISKAAAEAIREQRRRIDLSRRRRRPVAGQEDVNVANIIVAERPSARSADHRETAKEAASGRWKMSSRDRCSTSIQDRRSSVATSGTSRSMTSSSSTPPGCRSRPRHYDEQRKRLTRLMAGRKNCRDFRPASGLATACPSRRSTACARRSSVKATKEVAAQYPPPPARPGGRTTRRRRAGQADRPTEPRGRYPSVSRVAADPGFAAWQDPTKAGRPSRGCATPASGLRDDDCSSDQDRAAAQDYELSRSRGRPCIDAAPRNGRGTRRTGRTSRELRASPAAVERSPDAGLGGEPDPYVAVLVADGDKMGEAISQAGRPTQHRAFSASWRSSPTTPNASSSEHSGVLIYSRRR